MRRFINIPLENVPKVLGPSDSIINMIKGITDTKVRINYKKDAGVLCIIGSKENTDLAEKMILDILSGESPLIKDETKVEKKKKELKFETLQKTLNNNAVEKVYVSSLANPSHFCVQLVSPQNKKLIRLIEEMTSFYSLDKNSEIYTLKSVNVGQIIAAKCSRDDKWYRAQVFGYPGELKDQSPQTMIDLFCVDFGYAFYQALDHLRELKPNYLCLKFQAIEVTMDIVPVNSQFWSEESYNAFEEMVFSYERKVLMIKVTDFKEKSIYNTTGEPIPCVQLYESRDLSKLDIAQKLIRRGLAAPLIDVVGGITDAGCLRPDAEEEYKAIIKRVYNAGPEDHKGEPAVQCKKEPEDGICHELRDVDSSSKTIDELTDVQNFCIALGSTRNPAEPNRKPRKINIRLINHEASKNVLLLPNEQMYNSNGFVKLHDVVRKKEKTSLHKSKVTTGTKQEMINTDRSNSEALVEIMPNVIDKYNTKCIDVEQNNDNKSKCDNTNKTTAELNITTNSEILFSSNPMVSDQLNTEEVDKTRAEIANDMKLLESTKRKIEMIEKIIAEFAGVMTNSKDKINKSNAKVYDNANCLNNTKSDMAQGSIQGKKEIDTTTTPEVVQKEKENIKIVDPNKKVNEKVRSQETNTTNNEIIKETKDELIIGSIAKSIKNNRGKIKKGISKTKETHHHNNTKLKVRGKKGENIKNSNTEKDQANKTMNNKTDKQEVVGGTKLKKKANKKEGENKVKSKKTNETKSDEINETKTKENNAISCGNEKCKKKKKKL